MTEDGDLRSKVELDRRLLQWINLPGGPQVETWIGEKEAFSVAVEGGRETIIHVSRGEIEDAMNEGDWSRIQAKVIRAWRKWWGKVNKGIKYPGP